MDRYLREQQQHHDVFNMPRNFQQEPSYDHAPYQQDGSQQPNGQQFTNNGANGKYDQAARLRQSYTTRSASPLSRPPLFSPTIEGERGSSQGRPPSIPNATSPPPRTNVTSPRYLLDSAKQQQQNWMPRGNGMGPIDFHPSISPVSFSSIDRPHSSMSENAFAASQDSSFRPVVSAGSSGSGSNKESEFSIFVGDLSPDLREEDLVTQFLQPPPWLPNHPFAAALIHAQQAQGIWQPGARLGPAPFLSTKSAKIMTDPVTNASKGYGFVRFNLEADCNRALVEMQGVVVTPSNGMSPGRPLRVSTATPKNRSMPSSEPNNHHLQMPRPHNPAQTATSFLYANPNGNSASPSTTNTPLHQQPLPPPQLPHHHVQQQQLRTQQASPSQMPPFVSPTSPTSPFDAPNGGLPQQQPRPFLPMHAGFPGPDMQHMGPQQSHTPPTAPSNSQQASANDSAADPNNTTVFVGGLSSLISEATLRRYFEHFGEITYVKIPSGKGCGFVQFVRKQDAENAIQRMNGFPILNSKIRLSWGRSQGDKAAAAAAQTMAQYAQLGQLAGLAGLSTLSPSQLAQLAGLGSALSAAQANTQGANGYPNNDAAVAALANDPLSTLARQLAAANTGAGGLPGMGGMPGPLPPFLQQPNGLNGPPHHAPPPYQGNMNGHGPNGFDMDPRGGPRSHPGNGFRSPDHLQNDHGIRARPPFPQGLTSPQSENELAHAFANLDFDDGARTAPKGPPQSFAVRPPQPGQVDRFGRGYNRDPNAFMFSPFSPSDSPVVGGKSDLPQSNAQHYDEEPRFTNTSASPTR